METAKYNVWICRDKDGTVGIFGEKPEKLEEAEMWWVPAGATISCNLGFTSKFPGLKWEDDEPINATMTININQ